MKRQGATLLQSMHQPRLHLATAAAAPALGTVQRNEGGKERCPDPVAPQELARCCALGKVLELDGEQVGERVDEAAREGTPSLL